MKEQSLAQTQRNSSIELLRIIAMWVIVFYHFHVHVLSVYSDVPFFKAIQIPLHISVPIFVLISGYFGIHFSVSGFCKLFTKVGFYSLSLLLLFFILNILYSCPHALTKHQILDGVFFISRTNNLWFIRTYLLLYLLSPFWNKVLQGQNANQRIKILTVLAIIVLYIGIVGQNPGIDGKSVIYFLFVYTIGYTIRDFNLGERLSFRGLLFVYIALNLTIFLLYISVFNNRYLRIITWLLAYEYNSPICLISASMFFLIFAKLRLNSNAINKIASSVFAVYLISENLLVNVYLNDFVRYILNSYSIITLYCILILLTTIVFVVCICTDRITIGIQKYLSNGVYFCLNNVIDFLKSKTKKYL